MPQRFRADLIRRSIPSIDRAGTVGVHQFGG